MTKKLKKWTKEWIRRPWPNVWGWSSHFPGNVTRGSSSDHSNQWTWTPRKIKSQIHVWYSVILNFLDIETCTLISNAVDCKHNESAKWMPLRTKRKLLKLQRTSKECNNY
jgi:hypothetical protein